MSTTSVRKRIPIEEGIFSFGTGYEVGLRLRASSRYMYKYIPTLDTNRDNTGVNFDNQTWEPLEPETFGSPLLSSGEVICGERFENAEIQGANSGYLFGGTNGTGGNAIWDHTGTQKLATGSGVIRSIAHWHGLNPATTFITGPNIGTMRSTTDRATFANWAPAGLAQAGSHLLIYQNRIWISVGNKVYFTDILDPNNVRQFGQTNPLVVPMPVTVLDRVGVSDVDPGAQSHLFLGGLTQIWVLDGAPGGGNQVLRRLTGQVGVRDECNVASTSMGLFFFGTDRQLYLVPPGATDTLPIGYPIRDAFAFSGEVVLTWRFPYLCMFVGDVGKVLYFDTSGKDPKFWGMTDRYFNTAPRTSSIRFPSHNYFWVGGYDAPNNRSSLYKIRDADANAGMPGQSLTTGYVYEIGHEVALRKVHLTIRQGPVAKMFWVNSTDSEGTVFIRSITVPSGFGYKNFQIPITPQSTAPVGGTKYRGERGDFFFATLACNAREDVADLGMSAVQHWEIEYDVITRDKI